MYTKPLWQLQHTLQ